MKIIFQITFLCMWVVFVWEIAFKKNQKKKPKDRKGTLEIILCSFSSTGTVDTLDQIILC